MYFVAITVNSDNFMDNFADIVITNYTFKGHMNFKLHNHINHITYNFAFNYKVLKIDAKWEAYNYYKIGEGITIMVTS